MLQRRKFRGFEVAIAAILGIALFVAGLTGVALALIRGHWRLGVASLGTIGLAVLFALAALRRRPL